jgi:hypothetical protein
MRLAPYIMLAQRGGPVCAAVSFDTEGGAVASYRVHEEMVERGDRFVAVALFELRIDPDADLPIVYKLIHMKERSS